MSEHFQEKLIDEQLVYDGHLLKLFIRNVEFAKGRRGKREIIKHPGAVAMVPLMDDGRVMLIHQYRSAITNALYEIPAGTLEPNEDPQSAAIRELREEIGYRPGTLQKLGGIYVAPGYSTEYIHIYLASALQHDPLDADADEMIRPHPVSLNTAIEMISKGQIEDAKTVSGLLMAQKHLA